MSANPSHRELRRNLLGSTLADLAACDLWLWVGCPRCKDQREVRLHELAAERGSMKLFELLGRLRCSVARCGSPPATAVAFDRWGGRQVELLGPGALGAQARAGRLAPAQTPWADGDPRRKPENH